MDSVEMDTVTFDLQPETLQTSQGEGLVRPRVWRRFRIVSGGQTGVDQAAHQLACELGLPMGGWCPKGRLAEDGTIPAHFPLQETDSDLPKVRTELNVIDSDGTLVLTVGDPRDGTPLTETLAQRHGRPLLVMDMEQPAAVDAFRQWVAQHEVRVLNVAGPRESLRPGYINTRAREMLRELLEISRSRQA